jgi:hypothetical protein
MYWFYKDFFFYVHGSGGFYGRGGDRPSLGPYIMIFFLYYTNMYIFCRNTKNNNVLGDSMTILVIYNIIITYFTTVYFKI